MRYPVRICNISRVMLVDLHIESTSFTIGRSIGTKVTQHAIEIRNEINRPCIKRGIFSQTFSGDQELIIQRILLCQWTISESRKVKREYRYLVNTKSQRKINWHEPYTIYHSNRTFYFFENCNSLRNNNIFNNRYTTYFFHNEVQCLDDISSEPIFSVSTSCKWYKEKVIMY